MGTPQTQRKPRFFWQGALILLPVLILATVSAVSLWQDEQSAEQDARNRALKDVQNLGQALRTGVDGELQRYLTLVNVWTMGEFSQSQPNVESKFPEEKLQSDIARWEQDYPGLSFRGTHIPQGAILTDGRQLEPPEMAGAPEPPQWFRDLTPSQLEAWEELRNTVDSQPYVNQTNSIARSSEPNGIKAAQAVFLKSGPSDEARLAAQYITYQPERLIEQNTQGYTTESGISFEAIACYQLLTRPGAKLSAPLLMQIWQQSFETPSFVAPRLITLAQTLTNRAPLLQQEKVFWMGEYWAARTRCAETMQSVHESPELKPWKQLWWSQWVANGAAIAIFQPMTFVNGPGMIATNPPAGRGYTVLFVPRQILAAIFKHVLAQNQFLVPEYVSPALTVAGQPFELPSTNAVLDSANLLGEAEQKTGAIFAQDAIPFDVKFYLTSREQMLSAEQRRIKLFGALILGTLAAALVGLVAARRAFYRQLEVAEMKSNFVSSVSHELRAPIASVRLMAENLGNGKIAGAARQNEYFHFIVQECRRLSSLIENVLDFARIEQGHKQYEFEPTDVTALTRTTVKLMEPYAAEKGVKLELLNGTAETMEAVVDGRAIQQALVNLVDNAVKHSPKGRSVIIANEKTATPEPIIRISVADQGPGIPVAEREKIFERFYRSGSELRRETQGVGIGLSIVKHIVEAHGGRIVLESESGSGSRFTIELPIKKET